VKHRLGFFAVVLTPILAAQQPTPLTLERAVALAIERNERAAIAETAVEAAEARVRRARTAFFPRLDISGNLRGDYTDRTERTLSTSALVTQPIFDARVFPLYRAQRFERDAARFSASDSRRILGYDAAALFLATLSAEQVLRAAENRRTFAETNLTDVRARFEAGLVSSNDVTRARLEVATAERSLAQAAGDLSASRLQLQNLTREPALVLVTPAGLLEDAAHDPSHISDAMLIEARGRRGDLSAQRARVEATRAFAEEPNARFFPSVLLNAQTRNINDGPIFSNRNNEGFVGLSFSWPVFDAGVRGAERAERTALLRGEELELQLAQHELERELRTASSQLSAERESLRAASGARDAARTNAEETNVLYREGLASALELADATQRLFEAEVAEVTARYRMALAYLTMREAAGHAPAGVGE